MRKMFAIIALVATFTIVAYGQVTVPYEFTSGTTISSSQVNANFDALADALNRTGGTLSGNMTVSSNVTIDGVDISDFLTASQVLAPVVGSAGTPAFAMQTDTNTGLYYPGADELGISLGGTSEFTITATTTTWPSSNLVITAGNLTLTAGDLTLTSGNLVLTTVGITGNLLPSAGSTYDVGVTGTRWRDLFLSRDLGMAGSLTGTAASAATFSNASAVLTFSGNTAPEILFSAANGNVNSNADLIFEIDKDNDGTEVFEIRDGASTAIFNLTEAGLITWLGSMASNGGIVLDLDNDNNGTNTFTIRNGGDGVAFTVNEDGSFAGISGNFSVNASGLVTTQSVGTAALRTATGSTAVTTAATNVAMNDYSFFPKIELDDCATAVHDDFPLYLGAAAADDTVGYFSLGPASGGVNCSAGSVDVRWRYVTSSDNPDVWVLVDDLSGNIVAVWESEDPVGATPLRLAGATAHQVDVPSIADVDKLNKKSGKKAQIEARLAAKMQEKGWLQSLNGDVNNINNVPSAKKRMARAWFLRSAAAEAGETPADYIMENFVFQGGQLEAKD